MLDVQTLRIRGVEIMEGGVLALARGRQGNDNLHFHFDQCDLPSLGYTSGTSRNVDGSMGAPLEYFGRVRLGDDACLTVVYDSDKSNAIDDDDDSALVKISACAFEDDAVPAIQLFVLAIGATGTTSISFIGDEKNTTSDLYQGPRKYWQPSPRKQSHRPRPVVIVDSLSPYMMLLDEI
jgi:hypothetical protein